MSTTAADRVDWYRRMVEIRLFEEKVQELVMSGLVPSVDAIASDCRALVGG